MGLLQMQLSMHELKVKVEFVHCGFAIYTNYPSQI